MATVILSNDNIKVKVPIGMTLREVAQKTGASMEFGCRVGDCTTCIAYVDEGMQYLNEINQKEIKALEMLNMDSGQLRLMCQCHVVSEEGEIVISYQTSC
ncbi:MAG: (2Fe-2S)-binding protein [Sulfurovum sp.]|nr:(2Fe-2S)-binding protein [Sulfurovum sp.]